MMMLSALHVCISPGYGMDEECTLLWDKNKHRVVLLFNTLPMLPIPNPNYQSIPPTWANFVQNQSAHEQPFTGEH